MFITRSRLIKAGLFLFLILILMFPQAAFSGAKSGLLLWFNTLLPTLLPFMIISGMLIRIHATGIVSYLLYPFLKHILPVGRNGCYPVFVGFLAGMPVGAKTCADLKVQGLLKEEEGELLCAICNNPSPMFLLSYIAASELNSPKAGIWLILTLYLSSFFSGIIMHRLIADKRKNKGGMVKAQVSPANGVIRLELFDESIFSAFEVVTKVGGYVLIFSVLSSLLTLVPFRSPLIAALTSGVLEITTGIHAIANCMINQDLKLILAAAIAAFGGISGYAQTLSVINEAHFSKSRYFFTKIISAAIAALIIMVLLLVNIL